MQTRRTSWLVLSLVLALLSLLGAPGCGGDDPGTQDTGVDAGYTEPVCAEPFTDLSSLTMAYVDSADGIRAACQGIADRRYPIGREVIDRQTDAQLDAWFRTHGTFNDILNSFEIAVHEGTHIWDITMTSGGIWPYRVRNDLVIRTQSLHDFPRNEILALHANVGADMYASVYLMGQSGTQGFNNLLDEYNAYTHSIAARYCTRDGLPAGQSISARDGILTMMYYVELYLKVARTNHPSDYAAILADPEHLRLILTVWARAEFWLAKAAPIPALGINDAMIRTWTYDPANVMEIQMLRH